MYSRRLHAPSHPSPARGLRVAGQWRPRQGPLGMVPLKVARDVPARRETLLGDRRTWGSEPPLTDAEDAGQKVCAAQGPLAARNHSQRRPAAGRAGAAPAARRVHGAGSRGAAVGTRASCPPEGAARAWPADWPSERTGRGGAAGTPGAAGTVGAAIRSSRPTPHGGGCATEEGVPGGGCVVPEAKAALGGEVRGPSAAGGTPEALGAT